MLEVDIYIDSRGMRSNLDLDESMFPGFGDELLENVESSLQSGKQSQDLSLL